MNFYLSLLNTKKTLKIYYFIRLFMGKYVIYLYNEGCAVCLNVKSYSERPTLGPETIFDNWKPFKNDKKCFSFYLKSSFHFWDIYNFFLAFCLCRKTGQQIIIINISSNISTSKRNQAMKFGQLIKYSEKNILL